MKWFKMGVALREDRAENSIMQAVAVAVSAIMIMAGAMTAPGMINSTRATSAQSNLAIISGAQASYLARVGSYATTLSQLKSAFMGKNIDLSQCAGSNPDNCPAIKMISGGDIANGNCYMVFDTLSASSVYFTQSKSVGGNTPIVQIPSQPWPSTPNAVKPGTDPAAPANLLPDFPTNYDSSCAPWPTSLASITSRSVASPPTITGTMSNGVIGSAYSQFPSVTGSPTFAILSGVLPTGLTLNQATGEVGGSPTAGGTWIFSLKATNAYGSASKSFTISVPGRAPTISGTLPDAPISVAYSSYIITTDSPAVTLGSGSLPSGLYLDSANGRIYGTPNALGVFTFTLTATNVYGSANRSFTIAVGNPPTMSGTLPNGTIGVAYNQTLSATGSPTGYSVTTGALPPGLSLNSTSGTITGTPTATVSSTFTVTATNTFGAGTRSFTLLTGAAPTISSIQVLPDGIASTAYNQTISATGVPTFSISAGSLPAGLSIGGVSGAITGTPTTAMTSNFTVTATNAYGTASRAFTITISAMPAPAGLRLTSLQGLQARFDWSGVNNATGYRVTYNSANGQASSSVLFPGTGTTGTMTLTSGWSGSSYVTAVNGSNSALDSAAIQTDIPSSQMYGVNNQSIYGSANGNGYMAGTGGTYGSTLTSTDGHFSLIMQADGNLVIYNEVTSGVCGYTGTQGNAGTRMAMQPDGNLVLYNSAGTAIKYTGSSGSGARLSMQVDGNLVLYSSGGAVLWALISGPAQSFMTQAAC